MKKNLLLCVAGGTPQIITETLWALHQRNVRVDEIRVITTSDGRDKILLGKTKDQKRGGGPDESLLDSEKGQFFRFLKDYPDAGPIKFNDKCLYILTNKLTGVPSPRDDEKNWLSDIVTDEDNQHAANQICNIVSELASDENFHIHASIAGGRKTMGLYLMAAMQLFGRKDDEMSHVLVSKEAEIGAPKFFYKPPTRKDLLDPVGQPKRRDDGTVITTDDVDIHLARIPFIRLSGVGSEILKRPFVSYEKVVSVAQKNLEKYNLTFELTSNRVLVGDTEVNLGLGDFFVYFMFAYLRKIGREFMRVNDISLRDFDDVCRRFSRARGKECGYKDFFILRDRALESFNFYFYKEKYPHATDAYGVVKKTIWDSVSQIKVELKRALISEEYAITNQNKHRKKVEPMYGMKLDADRIHFI